jgi:ferric-dicitrate binding protein FerR (iron transport regulator)
VTVVGTRFTVDVANDVTIVSVEHGRVRVEKGTRTLFVGVGESVGSDDPRFDVPRSPRVTAEAPGTA